MRSHLTRNVFRRILANEPIVHQGCLHQSSRPAIYSLSPPRPLTSRNARLAPTYPGQCRGFGGFNFNIFSNRQEKKDVNMEAGIERMAELAKKERMQARLPSRGEIALAFRQLFDSKTQKKHSNLTDTEAQLALRSLRYLLGGDTSIDEYLPEDTILSAARVLRSSSAAPGQATVELSRLLYEEVEHSVETRNFMFLGYLHALCQAGQTVLAQDLFLNLENTVAKPPKGRVLDNVQTEIESDDVKHEVNDVTELPGQFSQADISYCWRTILNGFVNQDNQEEVERTLAMIEERDLVAQGVRRIMINFSCQRNDAEAIKKWWKLYKGSTSNRSGTYKSKGGAVVSRILMWCLANNQLDMGHEIVRDVMRSNPPKGVWDAVFLWAAGTKNSVDDIDRMMRVMEESNAALPNDANLREPDIDTINGLVEFAVSIKDPYMAERFIALGRDRNIQPNARTFVLQMDYRLNVKDTDGALVAYKNLQSHDTSSNEDVVTVNRLIVALCQTRRHDFETIMNVAADLSDRQADFEAATVAALSILHLTRDEHDDVIDLLNTHAFHYSSVDRANIRNAILAFSLDPKTPTGRAWLGYTVLRDVFDELQRPERMQIMSAFFGRGRPDMAVHIFQNMRRHSRDDTIPTVDTYVAAFMGLAKARQLDGLEVVHNQLKLDYNINPTTYLHNSLIIAYTACGQARRALSFWDDIVASREGPTYNSIHAALRACEKEAWGDVRAKKMWDLLRKRNVDLDQALWASYVAALAGNGDVGLAIKTLEEAVEQGELEVDPFILGSLHYTAAASEKQAEVESFGLQKYPAEWEMLESWGMEEEADGRRRYKIDRKIGP